MIKNFLLCFLALGLCSCSLFFDDEPQGQIVYHWAKEKTGVQKFAKDHSECLRVAEPTRWMPDVSSWFYSEEAKLKIRADWHSGKGIWATYVPYVGAQPLIVNSLRDDSEVNPKKYRQCMEGRGYWHRTANIPEITNIYVYKPQRVLQNKPFDPGDL